VILPLTRNSYKVTTAFVNDVLGGWGDTGIDKIYVTGASLGGGLAVITGAQTEAYTGKMVKVSQL
jgi:esterase/lipase